TRAWSRRRGFTRPGSPRATSAGRSRPRRRWGGSVSPATSGRPPCSWRPRTPAGLPARRSTSRAASAERTADSMANETETRGAPGAWLACAASPFAPPAYENHVVRGLQLLGLAVVAVTGFWGALDMDRTFIGGLCGAALGMMVGWLVGRASLGFQEYGWNTEE